MTNTDREVSHIRRLNPDELSRLYSDRRDSFLMKHVFSHFTLRNDYPTVSFRIESPRRNKRSFLVTQVTIFSLRKQHQYVAIIRLAQKVVSSGESKISYVLAVFKNNSDSFDNKKIFFLLKKYGQCTHMKYEELPEENKLTKLQVLGVDQDYLRPFYQISRDLQTVA